MKGGINKELDKISDQTARSCLQQYLEDQRNYSTRGHKKRLSRQERHQINPYIVSDGGYVQQHPAKMYRDMNIKEERFCKASVIVPINLESKDNIFYGVSDRACPLLVNPQHRRRYWQILKDLGQPRFTTKTAKWINAKAKPGERLKLLNQSTENFRDQLSTCLITYGPPLQSAQVLHFVAYLGETNNENFQVRDVNEYLKLTEKSRNMLSRQQAGKPNLIYPLKDAAFKREGFDRFAEVIPTRMVDNQSSMEVCVPVEDENVGAVAFWKISAWCEYMTEDLHGCYSSQTSCTPGVKTTVLCTVVKVRAQLLDVVDVTNMSWTKFNYIAKKYYHVVRDGKIRTYEDNQQHRERRTREQLKQTIKDIRSGDVKMVHLAPYPCQAVDDDQGREPTGGEGVDVDEMGVDEMGADEEDADWTWNPPQATRELDDTQEARDFDDIRMRIQTVKIYIMDLEDEYDLLLLLHQATGAEPANHPMALDSTGELANPNTRFQELHTFFEGSSPMVYQDIFRDTEESDDFLEDLRYHLDKDFMAELANLHSNTRANQRSWIQQIASCSKTGKKSQKGQPSWMGVAALQDQVTHVRKQVHDLQRELALLTQLQICINHGERPLPGVEQLPPQFVKDRMDCLQGFLLFNTTVLKQLFEHGPEGNALKPGKTMTPKITNVELPDAFISSLNILSQDSRMNQRVCISCMSSWTVGKRMRNPGDADHGADERSRQRSRSTVQNDAVYTCITLYEKMHALLHLQDMEYRAQMKIMQKADALLL